MAEGDLERLITGGPPPTVDAIPAIGVPAGYVPPPIRSRTAERAGRLLPEEDRAPVQGQVSYFEGDEWLPANSAVEDIARLQQRMVQAGLIPKGAKFRLGTWDEMTRAAYRDLLAYANATGLGDPNGGIPTLALQRYGLGTQQEVAKSVPPLRLPGPAEIAQAVKTTVKSLLGGRDPSSAEMEELSGLLTGITRQTAEQERSAQMAQAEGIGGEVVVDDPMARFKEELDRRYKPEVDRLERIEGVAEGRDNLLKNVLSLDSLIGGR